MPNDRVQKALKALDTQYEAYEASVPFAVETKHPIPMDTRAWSQILISILTGLEGAAQKKGADFKDGSDVKAANCWRAIDTPRFNGVAKAGTKAKHAGVIESFDKMPFLFFVLWDTSPKTNKPRCRVWVVRPQTDEKFRTLCADWYKNAKEERVRSGNLQLHPPRDKDRNEFTNNCGTLTYPLLFCAEREGKRFQVSTHDIMQLSEGKCETPEVELKGKLKTSAVKRPTSRRSRLNKSRG